MSTVAVLRQLPVIGAHVRSKCLWRCTNQPSSLSLRWSSCSNNSAVHADSGVALG